MECRGPTPLWGEGLAPPNRDGCAVSQRKTEGMEYPYFVCRGLASGRGVLPLPMRGAVGPQVTPMIARLPKQSPSSFVFPSKKKRNPNKAEYRPKRDSGDW